MPSAYVPKPRYFLALAILNGQVVSEDDETREIRASISHLDACLRNQMAPDDIMQSLRRKAVPVHRRRQGCAQ